MRRHWEPAPHNGLPRASSLRRRPAAATTRHNTPDAAKPPSANPSSEVADPVCRLPLSAFVYEPRGCTPWRPDADIGTTAACACRAKSNQRFTGRPMRSAACLCQERHSACVRCTESSDDPTGRSTHQSQREQTSPARACASVVGPCSCCHSWARSPRGRTRPRAAATSESKPSLLSVSGSLTSPFGKASQPP